MGLPEREIVHIYPRPRARGSVSTMEKRGVAFQKQCLYVDKILSRWRPQILRKRKGKLISFHVYIMAAGSLCLNERL